MEKGQIQQHEWFYHPVKQFDQQLCPHCACKRKHDENGDYVYQVQGGLDWGPIKPACITRYPEPQPHKGRFYRPSVTLQNKKIMVQDKCPHERVASYGITSGSYCKDCGKEL